MRKLDLYEGDQKGKRSAPFVRERVGGPPGARQSGTRQTGIEQKGETAWPQLAAMIRAPVAAGKIHPQGVVLEFNRK